MAHTATCPEATLRSACHNSSDLSALKIQTARGEGRGTEGGKALALSDPPTPQPSDQSTVIASIPTVYDAQVVVIDANKPICIIVPYLSSGPAGSLTAAVELCLTDLSSLCSCRRGPARGHRCSLSAKCPAGPACRVSLHSDWEANPCHRMDRYGQLELHF